MRYFEGKRFISIKVKIVILCLIVVIIPIFVITIHAYTSSQRLLETKYRELLVDLAKQTNIRIDEYLKEIEKMTLVSSFGISSGTRAADKANYPIQDYLRDDSDDNADEARGMLMNYILLKDSEISIYIYNLNGGKDLFISNGLEYDDSYSAKEEEWFRFFEASSSRMMTIDTHVDKQVKPNKTAIAHARKILDINSGTVLGIMVVSIDLGIIDVVNTRLQKALSSRFTIVDESDNIIYNADERLLGRKFSETVRPDESDHILVQSPFDRQRWTTFLYIPMSELSAEGYALQHRMIQLALLMLLFLILISLFLSSFITRPVKSLMNGILHVEMGQFEQVGDIKSRDEFGLLAVRFNRMSHELKRLVEQIQKDEVEKAAAEMRALQSQINPHFLYNTLATVKWIASLQRAEKIVIMTDSLISMLRYSARAEGTTASIGEELDNLRNYMTIQNVRYYNRIRMDIEADESLLSCQIPKLILQPMVENAIFHGLASMEEGGIVSVRITREFSGIAIYVCDNGVGMDEETVRLVERLLSGEQVREGGIGLLNVQRRIQLFSGHTQSIRFCTLPGEGSRFRIAFPEEYGLPGPVGKREASSAREV
ncbi:sensor histidine kinase [uncultured Paenibacillus sp.]|uniref:cache domain-containing sensor histidine kinase n=1 Tax=uncultured Paenibacillus sp. TaxID=227322 RepID=UPI0015AD8308|nr:sensor histidine kinase [uncultured Paenibacillus sp.]